MTATYKIREVRIDVRPGVTVVAEVDSIGTLSALLNELEEADLAPVAAGADRMNGSKGDGASASAPEARHDANDTPAARVERRAEIPLGSLQKANILGFKDDVPQLLRPNSMTPTDAVLVLLFAVEAGLQKPKINVESFKGLYEVQNIKSGSPLRMKLTDLRNSGYLDTKAYAADKSITLTVKGEKKAIDVIKALAAK